MATALRPSQPPMPPLRARSLGKLRIPARMDARRANVRLLREACEGVSNGDLGALIGGEGAGAQAREGAVVLTPGEVAMLLPMTVASRALCGILRERILSELGWAELDELTRSRLQVALSHVNAVLVFLADVDPRPAA